MSERPISDGADTLEEGRTRLADRLRADRRASARVSEAFLVVPRHLFVSVESAEQAYEDTAIVIKSDADGFPVSASTRPALMAIMLERLRLAAGHRVLEIGTGSGYNAALIAQIVGDSGSVVTIDVHPDLVDQARARLAAAGLADVTVVCGDGAGGVPGHAPYDRIIVTAGVWDLAPQWLAQLRGDGRIVAPVSIRGIQLAAAFEHAETYWVSRQACRCHFMRMTGLSAGPEVVVPLGPQPGLRALVADGGVPEAGPLYEAVCGPARQAPVPSGLRVGSIAELADLDLWLALTEPGLSRLNVMGRHEGRAGKGQRHIASRMSLGGFVECGSSGRIAVAALDVPPGLRQNDRSVEVAIRGYGTGSAALADRLARQAIVWDGLGRPGAGSLELAAYPAGTRRRAREGRIMIRRPHTVLEAGWSTPAWQGQRGT
jgi:protein-L-isoaspartate(D-aspartate) O-methyltransferase